MLTIAAHLSYWGAARVVPTFGPYSAFRVRFGGASRTWAPVM